MREHLKVIVEGDRFDVIPVDRSCKDYTGDSEWYLIYFPDYDRYLHSYYCEGDTLDPYTSIFHLTNDPDLAYAFFSIPDAAKTLRHFQTEIPLEWEMYHCFAVGYRGSTRMT